MMEKNILVARKESYSFPFHFLAKDLMVKNNGCGILFPRSH